MTPIEIIALNLACALIGYLLGNWLTIGRDRRKEFNALIEPIRYDLFVIRNHPQSEIRGAYMITFTLIRERLPYWKRKGFDRAIENYHKRKSEYNQSFQPDGMGGRISGDKTVECGLAISHSINDLLKYLKLK